MTKLKSTLFPFQIAAIASICKTVCTAFPEELIGPQPPDDLVNERRIEGIYEPWESCLADSFDGCPELRGIRYKDVCFNPDLGHVNELIEFFLEYYATASLELSLFNDLQHYLKDMPDEYYSQLTEEQRYSAARVLARQDWRTLKSAVALSDYLALDFGHIYIGIEKDGYAHS